MDTYADGHVVLVCSVSVHRVIVADDCFGDVYIVLLAKIMENLKLSSKWTLVSLPLNTCDVMQSQIHPKGRKQTDDKMFQMGIQLPIKHLDSSSEALLHR